ncbi:type IV toxin-antitoxin system AbiEi family antitoxin domain-containing protein [Candidatus Nitrospira salsa]
MSSCNGSKINRILRKWPYSTVAVSPWLEKQGAYQQLMHEYEKTSWVRRIGRGAYVREGDKVEWTGGLYALQKQLGLPIHVGGKTALSFQGYAHFLPMGKGITVTLFGLPNVKLPLWFKQYRWDVEIRYTTTNLFMSQDTHGLTQKDMGSYAVRLSTPERAVLEMLYEVPQRESYEEAELIMEGLTTLRPRLVQALLEDCTSVKVKRLFMVLAETSKHAWVTKLDLAQVAFGKGKRMLVKGGRLDPIYLITVPESRKG